ncbi:DUF1198 family protein [Salmonella enterica subsp. enterica]|nr:DUF1198 family protein [Salmonella enterica subsp. enterica]
MQNAAQVLLIWQMVIVDGGDQNLQRWHRLLQSAFSRADHRYTGTAGWAFCAKWNPICRRSTFQLRYNAFFSRKRVSTGCIDTLHYLVNKRR